MRYSKKKKSEVSEICARYLSVCKWCRGTDVQAQIIHDSCRVAHLIKENKVPEKKGAAERIQIKKNERTLQQHAAK